MLLINILSLSPSRKFFIPICLLYLQLNCTPHARHMEVFLTVRPQTLYLSDGTWKIERVLLQGHTDI